MKRHLWCLEFENGDFVSWGGAPRVFPTREEARQHVNHKMVFYGKAPEPVQVEVVKK